MPTEKTYQTGRQAVPSLCWMQRSFCWFCYEVAEIFGLKEACEQCHSVNVTCAG